MSTIHTAAVARGEPFLAAFTSLAYKLIDWACMLFLAVPVITLQKPLLEAAPHAGSYVLGGLLSCYGVVWFYGKDKA